MEIVFDDLFKFYNTYTFSIQAVTKTPVHTVCYETCLILNVFDCLLSSKHMRSGGRTNFCSGGEYKPKNAMLV